jgi:hypothetical protein
MAAPMKKKTSSGFFSTLLVPRTEPYTQVILQKDTMWTEDLEPRTRNLMNWLVTYPLHDLGEVI